MTEKESFATAFPSKIICQSLQTLRYIDDVCVYSLLIDYLLLQGCFKALDEEAKVPKGSSKGWYEKLKFSGSKTGTSKFASILCPPSKSTFSVVHYAGVVHYNPNNFMEKNVETLNNDLVVIMKTSTMPLVRRLFEDAADAAASASASSSSSSRGRRASESAPASTSSSSNKSISFKFQQQLTSLMTMLRATESHFVRCVKSNSKCRSLTFEPDLVQKQLLYSGVFEGTLVNSDLNVNRNNFLL